MEETASDSPTPAGEKSAEPAAPARRSMLTTVSAILLALFALPVLAVFILYVTEHVLLAAHDHHWDYYRLGPLYGLFCGYDLYYDLGKGPILNTIYGPMAYLSFLPVVWLPWNAYAWIIIAGISLNALYFVLPAAVLAWWAWRYKAASWAYGIHFPMIFAFICLKNEPTRISMISIHADAPALCYSGLACCCALFYGLDGRKKSPLLGAAIFTGLVLWTKQTFTPIVPVLFMFFLLVHGWRAALGYTLMLVPVSALTIAGFAFLVDYHALYFNAFVVPGKQPWSIPKNMEGMWIGSATLVGFIHTHFIIAAAVFCLQFAGVKASLRAPLDWLRAHPQGLLLLLALAEIPMATLGREKVGGWINNYSPVLYYLTLYYLISLPGTLQRTPRPEAAPVPSALPNLLGFLLAFCAAYPHSHHLRDYKERFKLFNQNEFVLYCKYMETHKGKLYYPFNPLAHLLIEGKMYHTSYALADRELGGFRITKKEFDQFTPKNPEMYVESFAHQFGITQQYMPDYSVREDVPELLYQVCMKRPPKPPPPPPPTPQATPPPPPEATSAPAMTPPPAPPEAMPAEPAPAATTPTEPTPAEPTPAEAKPN